MSLSKRQKKALLSDGFLPREVFQLSTARDGDKTTGSTVPMKVAFSSKPFKAMRKSRRKYIADLKKVGWNSQEIKAKINSFYAGSANIWSFLKLEYKNARKLTDFQTAIKLRARSRISRVLGRSYGRQMKPKALPRNLPKRPMYPAKPKLIRRVKISRRPKFHGL